VQQRPVDLKEWFYIAHPTQTNDVIKQIEGNMLLWFRTNNPTTSSLQIQDSEE
jgi:hypothetical protein